MFGEKTGSDVSAAIINLYGRSSIMNLLGCHRWSIKLRSVVFKEFLQTKNIDHAFSSGNKKVLCNEVVVLTSWS